MDSSQSHTPLRVIEIKSSVAAEKNEIRQSRQKQYDGFDVNWAEAPHAAMKYCRAGQSRHRAPS
jgi:hypothetical protein